MNLASIWNFIAGDSRRAPVAVALAVVVAYALLRASVPSAVVAVTFAGIIALGLAVSVFEKV
jgi:hypothetical protein